MFIWYKKKKIYIYIYIYGVGSEGSRGFGPFHFKPKTYVEEEEVPENKWRESRLRECTAEDDPVLGKPKS